METSANHPLGQGDNIMLMDKLTIGKQKHSPIEIEITDREEWLEMRKSDVTGTEASILFGNHYNLDLFTYWHQKRGTLVSTFEDNNLTFWGRNNEDAIARGVFEIEGWGDQGFTLEKSKSYYRHPTIQGSGATLDYILFSSVEHGNFPIAFEIKNVSEMAFKTLWVRNGKQAPPLYYEWQLQQQLSVTGFCAGIIACLVGGNQHYIFIRHRNEKAINALERKIVEFWEMPEPNVYMHDMPESTLKALYKPDGSILNLTDDLEADYWFTIHENRRKEQKEAEKQAEYARIQLLKIMGTASRIKCGEHIMNRSENDTIKITKQRQKLELSI